MIKITKKLPKNDQKLPKNYQKMTKKNKIYEKI